MSSDLRRQTREIKEALSRFEPEQLVDILTHVFRQYVIEGAAPPPASLSGQDELSGLSFPQLIERLQLRLDLPELRLLEVQGGRVLVRVEGRLVPLETGDTRPEPLPMARVTHVHTLPSPAAAPPPAAAPGTESREVASPPGVAPVGVAGSARPDGTARAHAQGPAASARPATSATPAAAPRPAASAPAPSGPARPAAGPDSKPAPAPARADKPAQPDKKDSADNGARFSLLEID
ncbi:MAG: hypothetical protein U1A78_20095 [Polyangia bacterium]